MAQAIYAMTIETVMGSSATTTARASRCFAIRSRPRWLGRSRDGVDGDGIPNQADHCPTLPNQNNLDSDGDGYVALITMTITMALKTHPQLYSYRQSTSDRQRHGWSQRRFEFDADGDGISDEIDNCPFVGNDDQVEMMQMVLAINATAAVMETWSQTKSICTQMTSIGFDLDSAVGDAVMTT